MTTLLKVKTNVIVKDKIFNNNNNLIIEEWKMGSKKMLTKDIRV